MVGLLGFACAAVGIVVGCGVDLAGTLVDGVDDVDSADRVGPKLPEGGGDVSVVVDAADGGADAEVDANTKCGLSTCVTSGGYCDDAGNDLCVIDCLTGGSCDAGVTCPAGLPCKVSCVAKDSCAGRIDCSKATSCDIACTGDNTCKGVDCAGTRCDVACSGKDTCRDSIDGSVTCLASVCNIACRGAGTNTCGDPVLCKSAQCAVTCGAESCDDGVTALGGDASIRCLGTNACGASGDKFARCVGTTKCLLECAASSCDKRLCCDSGLCLYDGGTGADCP